MICINKTRIKKLFVLLLTVLSLAMASAQPGSFADVFPKIDRHVDSVLKEWNVPGLSLGVVHKNRILYTKGYGYRDLEKKLPVETKTLFPIASNTKLFTSTLASMLHFDSVLSLDKPVRNYLPSLVFSSDELNAKTTIRDMLSHRTGLPRYDGIWVNAPFSRKELVSKISFMKQQLGFREGYLYNNMMYVAAGAAMEEVTGKSWETLIREKIFNPLQMKATCFSKEEALKYANYSLSYFLPDSSTRLAPKSYESIPASLGPAGIIKSNAEEMCSWMIALLNNGKINEQPVLPAKAIAETLIPNSISDKLGRYDELSNSLYCLGRNIYTYKGHKVASHGGAIDGFYSFVMLFPKDSLGIFVAVNAAHGRPLSNFIPYDVFDLLMKLPATPWSQRNMKDYKDALVREKKSEDSIKATQVKNTAPSHALNEYTGTYTHSAYGDITISLENNQLVLIFRSQRSVLHHFHYDHFATNEKGKDLPDFRLQFLTNEKGEIDRISTRPLDDLVTEFQKKKK